MRGNALCAMTLSVGRQTVRNFVLNIRKQNVSNKYLDTSPLVFSGPFHKAVCGYILPDIQE